MATADRRAKLERWARFLKAKTAEELETLANEDAIMNTARNALERLSLDLEAQRLAEERETAQLMHQHLMGAAFEAGEAKGEAIGLVKERKETVRTLCQVFDIPIDEARAKRLDALEASPLAELICWLKTERRWPQDT